MKKAFNIVANVCAIVLMSILLIGAIILLAQMADYMEYMPAISIGITVFLLLFSIATIVLAALAIAKCNTGKMRGLQIAVTVLVGVIAILEFIGSADGNSSGIVYGILCLIPVGFEIAAMCVNKTQPAPATPEAPKQQTIDEKIAELKHLKELGALTDEQYEAAIGTLINSAK